MAQNNNEKKIDEMTWKLLKELKFKQILYKYNVDKVDEIIKKFLRMKIADGELTVEDLRNIHDNISYKAKILVNRIGESWGVGDDGCYDIATAAVALGKENYEKCLKDYDYLVSMKKVTRQYENVLYPFNDVEHEF